MAYLLKILKEGIYKITEVNLAICKGWDTNVANTLNTLPLMYNLIYL